MSSIAANDLTASYKMQKYRIPHAKSKPRFRPFNFTRFEQHSQSRKIIAKSRLLMKCQKWTSRIEAKNLVLHLKM